MRPDTPRERQLPPDPVITETEAPGLAKKLREKHGISCGVPVSAKQITVKATESGHLVPVNDNAVTGELILKKFNQSLNAQYDGRNKKHQGQTKLTAAVTSLVDKAADGDKEAVNMIMDRIMGKPAQLTQNINVTSSMDDFLSGLGGEPNNGRSVIDTSATNSFEV